jgi:hypothetical protein
METNLTPLLAMKSKALLTLAIILDQFDQFWTILTNFIQVWTSLRINFKTFLTFCADGDQFDTFAGNEVQSLVDVGNLVEPHLASVGLLQSLAGDNLQQQHELEAWKKIDKNKIQHKFKNGILLPKLFLPF